MNDLKMVDTIAAINDATQDDDEYAGGDRPDTPRLARNSYRSRDMFRTVSHVRRRTQRELRTRVQRPAFGRLERLHATHTGVSACLRRARETGYWPGITADIKRAIIACDICTCHHQSIQKEPLMSHPAPSRLCEKVGVDIFTFADTDYLITVDYLSGWLEIDRVGATCRTLFTVFVNTSRDRAALGAIFR